MESSSRIYISMEFVALRISKRLCFVIFSIARKRLTFENVDRLLMVNTRTFDNNFKILLKTNVWNSGVSSLNDFIAKPVLRYSTWLMAVLAIAGNCLVLWGRITCHDDNRAVSLVIMNLAIADMLMGVYLLVIGVQDFRYRNEYQTVALDWIGSWKCTVIGMIAMVSCEVSMLILTFMSIERFLLIADPFRKARTRITASKVMQMMMLIWVMGLTLSIVPGKCYLIALISQNKF